MDSNDIERERGITSLAKNCAIEYGGTRDQPSSIRPGTPTSAVRSSACCRWSTAAACPRRRRRRADAADAVRHAQGAGHSVLKAIVVVTRSTVQARGRAGSVDQTFELFDKLGASWMSQLISRDLRIGACRAGRARITPSAGRTARRWGRWLGTFLGLPASVVAPSLLFEELECAGRAEKPKRLPLLPPPPMKRNEISIFSSNRRYE